MLWSSTEGFFPSPADETELAGGKAKARWIRPNNGAAPQRDKVRYQAQIGVAKTELAIPWRPGAPDCIAERQATARSAAPIVRLESPVIAGDRTADGTFEITYADGYVESVPFKASTTYSVEGLLPGQTVALALGSPSGPNQAPVLSYSAEVDVPAAGLVADEAGAIDAASASGIGTVADGYEGRAFAFTGRTELRMPADASLELADGFTVQVAARVAASSGNPEEQERVLVHKPGLFRLSQAETAAGTFARFTVVPVAGATTVTSAVPVSPDAWHVISGRVAGGEVAVAVGEDEQREPLGGTLLTGIAPIDVGPGFVGSLDAIRLFDAGRPYLSAFENGEQSVTLVADAGGRVATAIRSTGALPAWPEATPEAGERLYRVSSEDPYGSTPTLMGPLFANLRMEIENEAACSQTRIGYVHAELLAYAFRIVAGIWDSAPEDDLLGLAGALIVAPVKLGASVVNAGYRAVQGKPDGFDAWVVAEVTYRALNALYKRKVGVVVALHDYGVKIIGRVRRTAVAREARKVIEALRDALANRVNAIVETVKRLLKVPDSVKVRPARVFEVAKRVLPDFGKIYLDRIIRHSAAPEEMIEFLEKAAAEMTAGHFAQLLKIGQRFGSDVAGEPAMTRKAMEVLAEGIVNGALPASLEHIAKQQGRNAAVSVLEKVSDVMAAARRAGKELVNPARLLEELGHEQYSKAKGARAMLESLHPDDIVGDDFVLREAERRIANVRGPTEEGLWRRFDGYLEGRLGVRRFFESNGWSRLHGRGSRPFDGTVLELAKDLVFTQGHHKVDDAAVKLGELWYVVRVDVPVTAAAAAKLRNALADELSDPLLLEWFKRAWVRAEVDGHKGMEHVSTFIQQLREGKFFQIVDSTGKVYP